MQCSETAWMGPLNYNWPNIYETPTVPQMLHRDPLSAVCSIWTPESCLTVSLISQVTLGKSASPLGFRFLMCKMLSNSHSSGDCRE